MSKFIKTNQGYVRASAVISVQQTMDNVVRLDASGPITSHYVNSPIEDVLAQLEGSESSRPDKAPQGLTGPVAAPAKERLGFGSVRDKEPERDND